MGAALLCAVFTLAAAQMSSQAVAPESFTTAHETLARNVFQSSGTSESLHVEESLYRDMLSNQAVAQMSRPPTLAEKAIIDKAFNQVWESREELIASSIIKSYARSYTDADMNAMLRFYKSPAGQSIRAKSGIVARDLGQAQIDAFRDFAPAFYNELKFLWSEHKSP